MNNIYPADTLYFVIVALNVMLLLPLIGVGVNPFYYTLGCFVFRYAPYLIFYQQQKPVSQSGNRPIEIIAIVLNFIVNIIGIVLTIRLEDVFQFLILFINSIQAVMAFLWIMTVVSIENKRGLKQEDTFENRHRKYKEDRLWQKCFDLPAWLFMLFMTYTLYFL